MEAMGDAGGSDVVDSEAGQRLPVSEEDADAYRARREALLTAVLELGEELDALERQEDPDADRFRAAVRQLLATVQRQVEEADAPGGLLVQVREAAPWFASRVEQLRGEHDDLVERTRSLLDRPDDEVRRSLTEARDLSARLSRHRHRGTKLLLDAYMLDVSAGD
jgi:cytochrome c556